MKIANNASKWMVDAIKLHNKFRQNFQASKEAALFAGIFFGKAQAECEHGAWGEMMEAYCGEISETTIRRYIEFADQVLGWVKSQNPKILSEEQLLREAKAFVLQSPKGYISLLRQVGEMRKFGEYDEVKYRQRKMLGSTQIEFNFTDSVKHIEALTHLGEENYNFVMPEDSDPDQFLGDLETKLETALDRVRASRAQLPQKI
ncbi:MAG: hypothetical protein KGJ13_03475 [Patescibacteria group bacterium]|nr:hypothetical protein [Patescibacteria group bacterium]